MVTLARRAYVTAGGCHVACCAGNVTYCCAAGLTNFKVIRSDSPIAAYLA